MIFLGLSLVAPALTASPRESRNYVQPTERFDAGGGKATSGRHSQTTTVGGIGSEASSAGLKVVARNGYIGQLSDSTNFGENNPHGVASGDAGGDGQSNFSEFMAGTTPTNPELRFRLKLVTLPGQPAQKYLMFSPRLNDRSYTVEYSLDLAEGFKPLTNAQQLDFGEIRIVLDPDVPEPRKFYRVKISR